MRQDGLEVGLNEAALHLLRVPFLLGFQGCLLPKSREGNLAAAVLDLGAPDFHRREAQAVDGGAQLRDDVGAIVVSEEIGVLARPGIGLEAVELGAGGGHEPDAGQVGGGGQTAGDLLLELWPVAAGDDADIGYVAETGEDGCHFIVKSLLALGEGAIKVKGDQSFHAGQFVLFVG